MGMKFKDRLLKFREKADFSQTGLAKKSTALGCEISQQAIAKLEKQGGETKCIFEFAEACNVSVLDLDPDFFKSPYMMHVIKLLAKTKPELISKSILGAISEVDNNKIVFDDKINHIIDFITNPKNKKFTDGLIRIIDSFPDIEEGSDFIKSGDINQEKHNQK